MTKERRSQSTMVSRRGTARTSDYLLSNAFLPGATAWLVEVAGLSQRQLVGALKASAGRSPHRYQLQVRVDRAKARVASGEPIAPVAAATGFVDESHVTRQFRR
jgi:AraC-like DNA-binding protein